MNNFFIYLPDYNYTSGSTSSYHLATTSATYTPYVYTFPSTSTGTAVNSPQGRTYSFSVEKRDNIMIATCEELLIKVEATNEKILKQKAFDAVSLLRGGNSFPKKYLTLWGTHNAH